ncbi:MAG: glycosyltransferase family 9 protein, partial [Thermodesulfobacteriota bacterium]
IYEKEKHRGSKSKLRVLSSNAGLMRQIRRKKFDVAIGCVSSYSPRLARYTFLTGARIRIGYGEKGKTRAGLYYNHPLPAPEKPLHEVESVMALLGPLGIKGPAPALSVRSDAHTLKRVKKILDHGSGSGSGKSRGPLVAFHISSRRPENRWPVENFIELINGLTEGSGITPLVLWSPGAADNPLHPGDDEMAQRLADGLDTEPLMLRTKTLGELIAALSSSEMVVCLDGGAMHLAAGLGKPILAIWGSTDPQRWAPWHTRHIILKKPEAKASAVSVDEAAAAFTKLYAERALP